ncbi:uncharacterized protein LOC141649427 [Silene latifolia]|uniref:uncharacterized protein LOC141649427 n=1 Tax=Silene latifolia TaxID=37657 RepID=UPI003D76C8D0
MESILGSLKKVVQTRRTLNNFCCIYSFLSTIEPTNVKEALAEPDWIITMQEELQQFERNKALGLVVQGYNQQEGIDYNETFAPVARFEAIRLLIAFVAPKGMKLFQMDIKTAFLNGYFNEEVFVEQPYGFLDSKFQNHQKYIKELIRKFGMENSHSMPTPMVTDKKLTLDEDGMSVYETTYRGMIGSHLYLTASCPDIMFSVCDIQMQIMQVVLLIDKALPASLRLLDHAL